MKQNQIAVQCAFKYALVLCFPLVLMQGACDDIETIKPYDLPEGIGLSITLQEGEHAGLTVEPGREYYLEKLSLRSSVHGLRAPLALDWIKRTSVLRNMAWEHLHFMESVWDIPDAYRIDYFNTDRYPEQASHYRLSFTDAQGQAVGEAYNITRDQFMLGHFSGMRWIEGCSGLENCKIPSMEESSNTDVMLVSNGDCQSSGSGLYTISVTQSAPLDGSARVRVDSYAGDSMTDIPVTVNAPIYLDGTGEGASVSFVSGSSMTMVQAGDVWTVMCDQGEIEARQPVKATHLVYNTTIEVLLNEVSAEAFTFEVPEQAANMVFSWEMLPSSPFVVPIEQVQDDISYGLQAQMELTEPANGEYFEPGEEVGMTINFYDEKGNQLNPEGRLFSYLEFMQGQTNGIQYYNMPSEPCVEYFVDCRLNIMMVWFAGPINKIQQVYDPAHDHHSSHIEYYVPDMGLVMGGFAVPELWEIPQDNSYAFTIPEDADFGTYIALLKVSRVYKGQEVHLNPEIRFQVGTVEKTEFNPKVGNCEVCHRNAAHMSNLRHGATNYYTCKLCHKPPHGVASEIVHRIHIYSKDYKPNNNTCGLCHLEPGSNTRASKGVCGSCHTSVHQGEHIIEDIGDFEHCSSCHTKPIMAHENPISQ